MERRYLGNPDYMLGEILGKRVCLEDLCDDRIRLEIKIKTMDHRFRWNKLRRDRMIDELFDPRNFIKPEGIRR